MKLSIIIPVYKAEKWINRCLQSILIQDISENELEIICIDDGSPDKSYKIIQEFQKLHKNIILIRQDNKGVSIARNSGLSIAKGKYITFLDSDDELFNNSLLKILKSLNTDDNDVIICRSFGDKHEWFPWYNIFHDNEKLDINKLYNENFIHGSVWGCFYKRSFLNTNSIRFPEGLSNGEDNFFFTSCLYFAESVKFKDCKLYHVIEEENSLSRSYRKEQIDAMIYSFTILNKYISHLPKKQDKFFLFQILRYSLLSSLISRTYKTKGCGYRYLIKKNINRFTHFDLDNYFGPLRNKMLLMQYSFSLFYLLSSIKYFFSSRK